jgi:hypothetical protein
LFLVQLLDPKQVPVAELHEAPRMATSNLGWTSKRLIKLLFAGIYIRLDLLLDEQEGSATATGVAVAEVLTGT